MRFSKAFHRAAVVAALLGGAFVSSAAQAYDPFIGEVRSFGFNFCPRGWAAADGQLLPIHQNEALFSLFGTNYGGDGRTTFALPDLRGRVAIHMGTGPGLNPYQIGQKGGVESTTQSAGYAATAGQEGNKDAVAVVVDRGAVNNMQPYTVVNWCVATVGVFPSRN